MPMSAETGLLEATALPHERLQLIFRLQGTSLLLETMVGLGACQS
jgi:hypothetical protein